MRGAADNEKRRRVFAAVVGLARTPCLDRPRTRDVDRRLGQLVLVELAAGELRPERRVDAALGEQMKEGGLAAVGAVRARRARSDGATSALRRAAYLRRRCDGTSPIRP